MKIGIVLITLFIMVLLLFNQKEWIEYIKAGEWSTLKKIMGGDFKSVLLVTMGLMIIQNLFSLVPFLLLTAFNIWLFGFIYGYFWSLIGNILGSLLVFYLARYSIHSWGQNYKDVQLKKKVEENGFSTILIARMLPIIPSSIINIAGGISNIHQKDFILSTVIGHTIFVFVLSIFSLGIISLDQQYIAYLLVSLLVLFVIGIKVKTRKENVRDTV